MICIPVIKCIMDELKVKEICGSEVLSRANARKLYDYLDNDTVTIDLSGVSFVSRSVADEICVIIETYPDLRLCGMREDVAMMIELVRKGRKIKREPIPKATVSMTFNCRTMDDLRRALSFGS